jgi:hypothetical protein
MYDLGEIRVAVEILSIRDVTFLRDDVIPQLRRQRLKEYIPREIWRKGQAQSACELGASIACSVVVDSGRTTGTMNPDSSTGVNPRRLVTTWREQIQESIGTLEDANRFIKVVIDQKAPFDEVNSAVSIIEEVVQKVARFDDLGDRRFAILDKMQRNFCDWYPEVQVTIRNAMKTLNSGHDCYDSDYYATLGRQIWNGIYDQRREQFLPGMYDLGEIRVAVEILSIRDFTFFRRVVVPQLRRRRLHMYILTQIWRKVEEGDASELETLRAAKRTARS